MDRDYFDNIGRSIGSFLISLSEIQAKFLKDINILVSSDTFRGLLEFIQNIPDDVKETAFFKEIRKLENMELHYEDVIWIVEDFGEKYCDEVWKKVVEDEKKDLYNYIERIVLSDNMDKREKVIIILAHMEAIIYDTLSLSKTPKTKLKDNIEQVSVTENKGMTTEGFLRLYVLGIMYIVFANTESYKQEIDRRMPFRNNILHNGIVAYAEDEIEIVYELLLNYLAILIEVKRMLINNNV